MDLLEATVMEDSTCLEFLKTSQVGTEELSRAEANSLLLMEAMASVLKDANPEDLESAVSAEASLKLEGRATKVLDLKAQQPCTAVQPARLPS